MKYIIIISLSFLMFTSCTEQTVGVKNLAEETEQETNTTKYQAKIDIAQPEAGKVFKRGQSLFVKLNILEDEIIVIIYLLQLKYQIFISFL